ncbi:MAG: L-lactate permease [Wenzhouxiangella sp.]|nr:MAG: L-lactate permease [Wenzhouxiangella sp.]
MNSALAGLPIAAVLLAMAVLRWRALSAGALGFAVAVALLWLPAGFEQPAASMLAGVTLEALSSAAVILWIILPALVIFEFQSRVGALDRLRQALSEISDDRVVQTLLVAWFFGLFMEGAAGFGTPVALAAPLLVGLGFAPLRAVVLALLGHVGAVSFGAVGTPALTQIELLGLSPQALAGMTMLLHALPIFFLALALVRLASDEPLTGARIKLAASAAACFWFPAALLGWFVGPELPSLGGALVGGVVFVLLVRQHGTASSWQLADLAPYLLVLGLVLLTRLVSPLQEALSALWLGWTWRGYSGGLAPLYHPGTLLISSVLLAALLGGRSSTLKPSVQAAIGKLAPVALALLVMLMLARLMVHSGLIGQVATAVAGLGMLWPLFAPMVGVLGTFVTGSATASNVLFSEFQAATARALDLPLPAMAAAQNVGAAIGNAIAPHNIIAGAATVGMSGRDGEVMARTLRPVLVSALLAGLVLFGLLILV